MRKNIHIISSRLMYYMVMTFSYCDQSVLCVYPWIQNISLITFSMCSHQVSMFTEEVTVQLPPLDVMLSVGSQCCGSIHIWRLELQMLRH